MPCINQNNTFTPPYTTCQSSIYQVVTTYLVKYVNIMPCRLLGVAFFISKQSITAG